MHGRAVAREQEARQGRRQDDRVTHRHVGGGMANFALAPRDRHDANRAGKVADVERHLGIAVGADFHDAGIERDRRSGGRTSLQLRALIAAAADLSASALHTVDQLAVEVADLGRERLLAEIVIVRRRRLVVGQIEDADIDGGDDDACLLAGGEAPNLDRYVQARVRSDQCRRLEIDAERLSAAVDREPLHADGAARHALGRRVERPAQGRDEIRAGAPIAADGKLYLRRALRHVGRLRRQQPVADHIERQPPGRPRGHRDRHRVARRIVALVERDFEHVGRIGIGLDIETGVERN
jgi:hypothetical protein